MEDWAVGVGIVLGALAILVVLWVWARKQTFGLGGGALSVIGFALVGLSLWSNVTLSFGDIEAQFARVAERQAQLERHTAALQDSVEKGFRQVGTLAAELRRLPALDATRIRAALDSVPTRLDMVQPGGAVRPPRERIRP